MNERQSTTSPTPPDRESGLAFMMAALMLLPCFAMAGFAIDLGRGFVVRDNLQAAVDAAAVAAAHAPLDLADARAQAMFTANASPNALGAEPGRLVLPFERSATTLIVEGEAEVPPTVMAILFAAPTRVRVQAEVDLTVSPAILAR